MMNAATLMNNYELDIVTGGTDFRENAIETLNNLRWIKNSPHNNPNLIIPKSLDNKYSA